MADEPNTAEDGLPFKDLRAYGILWAINRYLFHPRGYALALHYPDGVTVEQIKNFEVEPTGWSIMGDGTEPWAFTEKDDDEQFMAFEQLLKGTVFISPVTVDPDKEATDG